MSELEQTARPSFPAGTLCWADLGTSDLEAAKQFYTSLFGWSVFDAPTGDGSLYSMLRKGERDVVALFQRSLPDITPSWLAYASVDDAERSAERTRSLGGEVLMGPFDVFTAGRMAVVQDPSGATIALWEAHDHPGAGAIYEPGALCWFELMSTDPGRAQDFYSALLGWGASPMEIDGVSYTVFSCGEQSVAGMVRIPESESEPRSYWLPYFLVEDCDAIAERTRALGGQVLSPPADIPGIGRYAVLRDPQGATLCVLAVPRADA